MSATANVKTIGVGPNDTLLVDNDDNNPDVQQYYKDALTAANVPFHDVGSEGRRIDAAAGIPDGLHERRLVHRQQLPGPRRRRTRTKLKGSSTPAAGC